MSGGERNFTLPKNIDHYLAALSKLYAKEGKKQLQTILVNSKVRVHEEWDYDNWDGGQYGHALYLMTPEELFLKIVKDKDSFRQEIKDGLNSLHNVPKEYIAAVFLELDILEDQDWRRESGLLLSGERTVAIEAISRVWGTDGYRIFLSHKNEVKKKAAELKEALQLFGIAGFVAHEDIQPTKQWQTEIENALFSMDAFVCLMTEGFHESDWTDQEVGVAFGRGVPIVSAKLGRDPYGFIGKFQALSCSWDTAAKEITKILINHEKLLNAYVKAVENCSCYDDGNTLSEILPHIRRLSLHQTDQLITAYNENTQVRDSFGFNGSKPRLFGDGLLPHLQRLTSRQYAVMRSGKIKVE